VLLGQGFDGCLLRKTCGARCSSDETGGRFVCDFGAGGLDAMPHCEAGYVVAFAEDRDLFAFEHDLLRWAVACRIVLEDEGYPIVEAC
jgi:hypothetical protein